MGDPGLMPFLWFKVALVAAFLVYAIQQIIAMRRDVAAARKQEAEEAAAVAARPVGDLAHEAQIVISADNDIARQANRRAA